MGTIIWKENPGNQEGRVACNEESCFLECCIIFHLVLCSVCCKFNLSPVYCALFTDSNKYHYLGYIYLHTFAGVCMVDIFSGGTEPWSALVLSTLGIPGHLCCIRVVITRTRARCPEGICIAFPLQYFEVSTRNVSHNDCKHCSGNIFCDVY